MEVWDITYLGERELVELKGKRPSFLSFVKKIQKIILSKIRIDGLMTAEELYRISKNELPASNPRDFGTAMKDLEDRERIECLLLDGLNLSYSTIESELRDKPKEMEISKEMEPFDSLLIGDITRLLNKDIEANEQVISQDSSNHSNFMPLMIKQPFTPEERAQIKETVVRDYGGGERIVDWEGISFGDIVARVSYLPETHTTSLWDLPDVAFEVITVEHIVEDDSRDMYYILARLLQDIQGGKRSIPKGAVLVLEMNRAVNDGYELYKLPSFEAVKTEDKDFWIPIISSFVIRNPDLLFEDFLDGYKDVDWEPDSELLEELQHLYSNISEKYKRIDELNEVDSLDDLYEMLRSRRVIGDIDNFVTSEKVIQAIGEIKQEYDDIIEYHESEGISKLKKPKYYDEIFEGSSGEYISRLLKEYLPTRRGGNVILEKLIELHDMRAPFDEERITDKLERFIVKSRSFDEDLGEDPQFYMGS